MKSLPDYWLDAIEGDERAARLLRLTEDIIADLYNGDRWEELSAYIYDKEPDWLNEVLLSPAGKVVVCSLLKIHEPKWVGNLAEKLAEKEMEND